MKFEVGVEIASPELIDNDFDFIRYYLNFKYIGHTLLPGVTTSEIFIGGSNNALPPQKYFAVGFSYKSLEGMEFRTIGSEDIFLGNQTAAFYVSHNFGIWIFKKSGLPLIKSIPLSLSFHGGAFWTDFKNHKTQPGDELLITAPKAYSEIGFSIGRIPPLYFLNLDFSWQLSDYNTNFFSWRLKFSMY